MRGEILSILSVSFGWGAFTTEVRKWGIHFGAIEFFKEFQIRGKADYICIQSVSGHSDRL